MLLCHFEMTIEIIARIVSMLSAASGQSYDGVSNGNYVLAARPVAAISEEVKGESGLSSRVRIENGIAYVNSESKVSSDLPSLSLENHVAGNANFGYGAEKKDYFWRKLSESSPAHDVSGRVNDFNRGGGVLDYYVELLERSVKDKIKLEEDVLYLNGGIKGGGYFGFGNVGVETKGKEVFSEMKSRLDVGTSGLEDSVMEVETSENKGKSFGDVVYGGVLGKRIFAGENVGVDAYGFSRNCSEGESGLGIVVRSGIMDGFVDSEGYFGLVKLLGGNGKFNFSDDISRRGSFVGGSVDVNRLLKGKEGVYGFVEKSEDVQKFGGAVCGKSFRVSGGVAGEDDSRKLFVEADVDQLSVLIEYSNVGGVENFGLSSELEIKDGFFVGVSGSAEGGIGSGMFEIKVSF